MKKLAIATLCGTFFISKGMDQSKGQKIDLKSPSLDEQIQFENVYQKNVDNNIKINSSLFQSTENRFDVNNNDTKFNPSSFQSTTELHSDVDADFDPELVQSVLKVSPETKLITEKICFPERFDKFEHLWILFGPPGIGKSVLAQAIAIKSNAKSKFVRCPALLDKYRNGTICNLENLFKEVLSSNNKTVVILDEFNALFENYKSKNNDSAETAASFWTLFDSIRYHKNLFLIGTSNKLSEIPIQLKTRIANLIIIIKNTDERTVNTINYCIKKYRCLPDCTSKGILALIKKDKNFSSPRAIESLFQLAADQTKLKNSDRLLSKKHIESAYQKMVHILRDVLKIEYEPESERERQERHHKENMKMQKELAFEQRLLQVNLAEQNERFARNEHHKQVKEEANGSWYGSIPLFGSMMAANEKLKINSREKIKEELEDNPKVFNNILHNQKSLQFGEIYSKWDNLECDDDKLGDDIETIFKGIIRDQGADYSQLNKALDELRKSRCKSQALNFINESIKELESKSSSSEETNKHKGESSPNQKKENRE